MAYVQEWDMLEKRLTNERRRERRSGHRQELPELCDVPAGGRK
jgi:hypothetical protein